MHREVIRQYLKHTEPGKVAARLGNGIICRMFYVAGVNHFWAMDQHDKWKRFGLFWHGCMDGFSGKILWLVIWWTNSNPRFVCAQYVKAVRTVGGMSLSFPSFIVGVSDSKSGAPCVTQSDLGTENYNVAYAHTHIRQALDPTLAGSIQHNWKRGHTNIKPEQMWWRFRRVWVKGFEELLEKGVREQWYNNVNVADRYVLRRLREVLKLKEHCRLVFRWLAIPWLQKEADSYVYDHNTSRRRANRRKILPNGVPDVMFENPESFDARDFKVKYFDQKFYILILSCRSLFRTQCLRTPNVSGHHPPTPSSTLFLHAVRNTFLLFTRKSGAQKWVFIRSGTFTIRCAMLWTQNCCSSPVLGLSMKKVDPRIPTQITRLSKIFSPVNSAGMEFLLCSMKVKQIVWLFPASNWIMLRQSMTQMLAVCCSLS